jgi:hypothetical protein
VGYGVVPNAVGHDGRCIVLQNLPYIFANRDKKYKKNSKFSTACWPDGPVRGFGLDSWEVGLGLRGDCGLVWPSGSWNKSLFLVELSKKKSASVISYMYSSTGDSLP